MEIGSEPITLAEELVLRMRPQLMSCHRMRLKASEWNYSICSPFWRIYINQEAGAFIDSMGERHHLVPGVPCVIPARVPFRTGLIGPVTHDFIHFDMPFLVPQVMRQWFEKPLMLVDSKPISAIYRCWSEALTLSEPAPLVAFAWARTLMDAVVATLFERMDPKVRGACLRWLEAGDGMAPALACIEQRISSPPTNAELANLCGVSTGYFVRRFSDEVGLSPARYGLERRIIAAASQLSDSDSHIEEIAENCGFPDRYYFSRVFKANQGISPAAYRKIHRAGKLA
jgi:AraC-like DNA-binding protein